MQDTYPNSADLGDTPSFEDFLTEQKPHAPSNDAMDALAAKASRELRHSGERYRAFAENNSEGIWLCEAEEPIPIALSEEEQIDRMYRLGYLAECNDAMARMYGLTSAEEMLGARLGDLLIREKPENEAFLRAFIQSGYRLHDAESVEQDRNGCIRHFANSMFGIIEDGSLVRVWGTQRDITRQKEAEESLRIAAEKLREREERFLRLADAAPMLIWMTDAEGRGTYFNQRWLAFRGRSTKQEAGHGYTDGVHPDDRERMRRTARRAVKAHQPFTSEYRLLRADGEYRWVLDSSVPLFDTDGVYEGYFGSCVDITERKLAEAERAAMHAQQRRFLREMLYGLTGGRLTLCSNRDELPTPLSAYATAPPVLLSPETLCVLRANLRSAAIACGMSEERGADLMLAVGEASMNAVVHAGGGEGTIFVCENTGMMQVWVTDHGRGIAEESLHRATLERGFTTAGTLGHGFWMILRTVDQVWLLTGKTGTTIVLEQAQTEVRPPWMEDY